MKPMPHDDTDLSPHPATPPVITPADSDSTDTEHDGPGEQPESEPEPEPAPEPEPESTTAHAYDDPEWPRLPPPLRRVQSDPAPSLNHEHGSDRDSEREQQVTPAPAETADGASASDSDSTFHGFPAQPDSARPRSDSSSSQDSDDIIAPEVARRGARRRHPATSSSDDSEFDSPPPKTNRKTPRQSRKRRDPDPDYDPGPARKHALCRGEKRHPDTDSEPGPASKHALFKGSKRPHPPGQRQTRKFLRTHAISLINSLPGRKSPITDDYLRTLTPEQLLQLILHFASLQMLPPISAGQPPATPAPFPTQPERQHEQTSSDHRKPTRVAPPVPTRRPATRADPIPTRSPIGARRWFTRTPKFPHFLTTGAHKKTFRNPPPPKPERHSPAPFPVLHKQNEANH